MSSSLSDFVYEILRQSLNAGRWRASKEHARALCDCGSRDCDAVAAEFAGLGAGGPPGALRDRRGGAVGPAAGAGERAGQRERTVSAGDDAGPVGLQLCDGHVRQPADRTKHVR